MTFFSNYGFLNTFWPRFKLTNLVIFVAKLPFNQRVAKLHKKPYFPRPGISWTAQKDQVNIIFPSTFWLRKKPYFPSTKSSKQELFSNE